MNIINNLLAGGSKATATILPIMFASVTSFAQIFNVGVLDDVSNSTPTGLLDPKKVLKTVASELELKDANSKASVNLYNAVIGDPNIVTVSVATLPADEDTPLLLRQRQTARWVKKVLDNLESVEQTEHQTTQLYRSLLSISAQMTDNADRTLWIISSDFIENGVGDFYNYRKNPPGLIDKMHEIVSDMASDSGLPDLRDAEVILICQNPDDELSFWATKWWRIAMIKYMKAKSVRIKATL